MHAEEDALARFAATVGRARARRTRVDVYVARVDAAMRMKMARPCARCAERLRACPFLRIRYVHYSTEAGWARVRLRELDGYEQGERRPDGNERGVDARRELGERTTRRVHLI